MSTTLAVGGSPLDIYQIATWIRQDTVSSPPSSGTGVAWSPNGSYLAVADSSTPYVLIYNTSNYSRVSNPVTLPTSGAFAVAFSPDGTYLAVAHTSSPYVTVYTVSGWTKISNPATLPAHSAFADARGVAWSHDSTKLFVAIAVDGVNSGDAADHSVNVYTFPGFTRLTSFAYMPGYCNGGAFSASSTWLATAEFDSPYVKRYLVSDWSTLSNPANLPAGPVNGVAFSPNGTWLACAHNSSPYVTIYATSGWTKLTDPVNLPTGDGAAVAFSSDSAYLAVAHATTPFITIYNTGDWSKVANPAILPSAAQAVAFGSPTIPPTGFALIFPMKVC